MTENKGTTKSGTRFKKCFSVKMFVHKCFNTGIQVHRVKINLWKN